MNNYSGHEFMGSRYESGLTTKEIAKRVRAYLKKQFPDCKFSVRAKYFSGGSELSIALMGAPFEAFLENPVGYAQLNHFTLLHDYPDYDNPNAPLCNGRKLTREAWELLRDVTKFALSFNRDDSEPMLDYYDTNFYFDLSIGRWDKPFKVTKVEVKA